jgi:uncharacterized membrane protein YsdA (DUF1294 family)
MRSAFTGSFDLPGGLVWLVGWMIVISVIAFLAHGLDKRAAVRHHRRVPEARLHLLELLGGWPGAVLAMLLFRHKIRKVSYLAVTAAIVLLWVVPPLWLGLGR